jgi:hypothetical protein
MSVSGGLCSIYCVAPTFYTELVREQQRAATEADAKQMSQPSIRSPLEYYSTCIPEIRTHWHASRQVSKMYVYISTYILIIKQKHAHLSKHR